MDTWRLDMLPDDVLFIIFDYCDLCDFTQLDQVCKRFHYIIHNVYWNCRYKKLLITNQVSEQFRKRCNLLLPSYSKYFISQNWVRGSYQKRELYIEEVMPQLQLTSDKLWWKNDNMIFGLSRHKTTHETNTFSCDRTFPDISHYIERFILWRDYIVTGHEDGSIVWQAESPVKDEYTGCNKCIIKKQLIIHNSISALDATSNIIFSAFGSEYAIIRVENSLDIDSINNDNIVRKEILGRNIQSLAIHPLGTILSVVSEDKFSVPDRILHIDLEKIFSDFEMRLTPRYQGTKDILWEDSNTLLMCSSYEIQKYDFRINDYVSEFYSNSLDKRIYCISSDHHNTMITGTDYCNVVLWDQRMPNFVQMYSMHTKCSFNDPIYSLQFDSTRLYCATNFFLYELDFSKRRCSDYKSNPVWGQIYQESIFKQHYDYND